MDANQTTAPETAQEARPLTESERTLRYLCGHFVARVKALNLKGKRRDDEAMSYFVGAAQALSVTLGNDHETTRRVTSWIGFILMYRGYSAVEEEVKADA